MIFLALVLLYVILFLMDGRTARKRNKRNRVSVRDIPATVPDYPGRHGL